MDKANLWLIWNAAYRADMNGIEHLWADIKRRYRREIAWHRVNGRDFNHMELVRYVVEQTPDELAKRCARQGEHCIQVAKPIENLHWEEEPAYDWVEHSKAQHAWETGMAARANMESEGEDEDEIV
jgi:hypothetical protein